VDGFFDAVEDVLEAYGIDPVRLDPEDLASSEVTSQYVMIFLNCGVDAPFFLDERADIVSNLRDYVLNGGLLYASDLELPLVMAMFPDHVEDMGDGDQQMVQADVAYAGLADFLGGQSTVQIAYNLDGWASLVGVGSGAQVLLRGSYTGWPDGDDEPLAIFISEGHGQVIYTTFHNNAQATDDQWAVLRYFLFRTGHVQSAPSTSAIGLGASHAPLAGTRDHQVEERRRLYRERRPLHHHPH
jgi:hypothetical protein